MNDLIVINGKKYSITSILARAATCTNIIVTNEVEMDTAVSDKKYPHEEAVICSVEGKLYFLIGNEHQNFDGEDKIAARYRLLSKVQLKECLWIAPEQYGPRDEYNDQQTPRQKPSMPYREKNRFSRY